MNQAEKELHDLIEDADIKTGRLQNAGETGKALYWMGFSSGLEKAMKVYQRMERMKCLESQSE